MKCDVCRVNPAVIFVQQVSRGSSIELHLCETCALDRGFSTTENKIDISLGGLFSGVIQGSIEGTVGQSSDNSGKNIKCPLCGLSLADIKKHHRAGCADCYQQFRAEIVSMLRREGVEISYAGELPSKLEAFKTSKIDPENLKKELRRAIDQEDYEMAAYYRDRIRTLEGPL